MGVELSPKMVRYARRRQLKNGQTNVEFQYADGAHLDQFHDGQFDYATMSMVLHEMPGSAREPVIREVRRIASKIILADYITPLRSGLENVSVHLSEMLAGRRHYNGFRDYQKNGGMDFILNNNHLSKIDETTRGILRIVVAG